MRAKGETVEEIEVSGIDELQQRYLDDIIVELRPLLRDGKPAAVKCRQLRGISYMAMGKGIPIVTPRSNGDGHAREADEADNERMEYAKKIVSRGIVAVRECWRINGGEWQERWTPVDVVYDSEPGEGQMHIRQFDIHDSILRCFNAMFADIMEGGRLAGTAAASFRSAGSGDALPDGEALGQVAARDRVRQKRRAGV